MLLEDILKDSGLVDQEEEFLYKVKIHQVIFYQV